MKRLFVACASTSVSTSQRTLTNVDPKSTRSCPKIDTKVIQNHSQIEQKLVEKPTEAHDRGREPANFLDVGGGATPEKMVKAFKLISQDKKVKVILVNIFAGINRCDWVAEGIIQALQKIKIDMPLVIRLSGTNVEKGNKILKESKIKYIEASTLEDAANKAVAALKKLKN